MPVQKPNDDSEGEDVAERDGATLSQIARASGVSVGTVSKALNGKGQLSAATRIRIREVAKDLGVERSASDGRGFGRSLVVGILSTDSYGRFTIPILTGAEDAFAAEQTAMLLAESRGDPIRERHYARTLQEQRVDGIIIAGKSSDPRPSLRSLVRVPVVYALSPSRDDSDVSVIPNDKEGATRAIEHLVNGGRRNIAVVAGRRSSSASTNRVEGAVRAIQCSEASLYQGAPLYGAWSERWGYEAAQRLLVNQRSTGEPFDAVFCASDQIARGVIDCLREGGVSIPRDVAIVGVDNWDVMVKAARPNISSIDLNLREVGKTAADLLVQQIIGNHVTGGIHYTDCFLEPRQSS